MAQCLVLALAAVVLAGFTMPRAALAEDTPELAEVVTPPAAPMSGINSRLRVQWYFLCAPYSTGGQRPVTGNFPETDPRPQLANAALSHFGEACVRGVIVAKLSCTEQQRTAAPSLVWTQSMGCAPFSVWG